MLVLFEYFGQGLKNFPDHRSDALFLLHQVLKNNYDVILKANFGGIDDQSKQRLQDSFNLIVVYGHVVAVFYDLTNDVPAFSNDGCCGLLGGA